MLLYNLDAGYVSSAIRFLLCFYMSLQSFWFRTPALQRLSVLSYVIDDKQSVFCPVAVILSNMLLHFLTTVLLWRSTSSASELPLLSMLSSRSNCKAAGF